MRALAMIMQICLKIDFRCVATVILTADTQITDDDVSLRWHSRAGWWVAHEPEYTPGASQGPMPSPPGQSACLRVDVERIFMGAVVDSSQDRRETFFLRLLTVIAEMQEVNQETARSHVLSMIQVDPW